MDRSASTAAGLKTEFDTLVDRFGMSGVAATVIAPGSDPVTLVSGVTRAVPHRSIDARTPFSIASSGKHAVGLALAALETDGRLETDDLLAHWLPDVPAAWGGRTLMQLLRHTSGLPDYLAEQPEPPPRERAAFIRRYSHLLPYFEPDTAWSYSNTNYILLGFVIAAAAGMPFANYLRRRLLDRTACEGVAIGGPDIPVVETGIDVFAAIEDEARTRDVIGDGDLVMSPRGAAAWDRVVAGAAGLSAASAAKLVSAGFFATGRPVPYAAGWFTDCIAQRACCWHAGGFAGWSAFVQRVPVVGAAVWLLCDADVSNTRAQRYIAQRLLESAAPGTTALALEPIVDVAPSLTEMARWAMFRSNGDGPRLDLLAPEMRVVAERVGARRGVSNLWVGEEPLAFEVVEDAVESGSRFRRYRVTYRERVEHLRVGHAPDGRLFWAYAA